MTRYVREIIEDPDNPGQYLLDLGNELCEEAGWKEGDKLNWIDNKDGTYSIMKQNEISSDYHEEIRLSRELAKSIEQLTEQYDRILPQSVMQSYKKLKEHYEKQIQDDIQ